jgi:hypothetical protein
MVAILRKLYKGKDITAFIKKKAEVSVKEFTQQMRDMLKGELFRSQQEYVEKMFLNRVLK